MTHPVPATPPVTGDPNFAKSYPLTKGWIIGFIVGIFVMMILNSLVYKVPKEWDWINLIFAFGFGTTTGVALQLRHEKRFAEIRPFVRGQILGLLIVSPMFLIGMVGRHYYGEPGYWIALIGGPTVVILGLIAVKKLRGQPRP